MDSIMHVSGGTATLVAGLCFAIGYIVGLVLGRKMDNIAVWPAILLGIACCILRGYSEPLGMAAIAAVSVLHYCIGVLTIAIFRSASSSSATK